MDALAGGLTAALTDRPDDLRQALDTALRAFPAGPEPAAEPSSTVSVVRWTDSTVDVLVLGDSPVHVLFATGREEGTSSA